MMTDLIRRKFRWAWENARTIVCHYGKESQIMKSVEENIELSQALIHYKDGKGTLDEVVDEMADVTVMCMQLAQALDIEHTLLDRIGYKIDRQLKRIENENRKAE